MASRVFQPIGTTGGKQRVSDVARRPELTCEYLDGTELRVENSATWVTRQVSGSTSSSTQIHWSVNRTSVSSARTRSGLALILTAIGLFRFDRTMAYGRPGTSV